MDNSVSNFELGNITIASNGWIYKTDTTRVRLKQGDTITLYPGDIIGLSDYSDARYYIGWRRKDRTYGLAGWLTDDFKISEQGEYIILIANRTTVETANLNALASLFFISGTAYTRINKLEKLNLLDTIEYPGYIYSNGNIITPTQQKEVYTNAYKCKYDDKFVLILTRADTSIPLWLAYATYDQNGELIARRVIVNSDTPVEKYKYILYIPDQDCAYVRFTYRTNGISVEIYSEYSNNGYAYLMVEQEKINQIYNYAVNENIKSVNHRGYTTAPENTLPAYKLSKEKGFKYVECDVLFTSDQVPVLLHDNTINRTARNADGTEIAQTIPINTITYEQALEYDFGIYKGEQYAGTKIPTLTEFLLLCRNLGLSPYIELKSDGNYTESQIHDLIDLVKQCGMHGKVVWISFSSSYLAYIKTYDEKARLGYVAGSITSGVITIAESLKTNSNDVFIDIQASSITDESIALAVSANIPVEVWTVDSVNTIIALNPYITGVTSNNLIAGYELYKRNIN